MLNTVILMGRLTSGPELRYTPNDTAVTSFTLAVERSYVTVSYTHLTLPTTERV